MTPLNFTWRGEVYRGEKKITYSFLVFWILWLYEIIFLGMTTWLFFLTDTLVASVTICFMGFITLFNLYRYLRGTWHGWTFLVEKGVLVFTCFILVIFGYIHTIWIPSYYIQAWVMSQLLGLSLYLVELQV
jgi:hypothetical protein